MAVLHPEIKNRNASRPETLSITMLPHAEHSAPDLARRGTVKTLLTPPPSGASEGHTKHKGTVCLDLGPLPKTPHYRKE